jgi:hypothetical protein
MRSRHQTPQEIRATRISCCAALAKSTCGFLQQKSHESLQRHQIDAASCHNQLTGGLWSATADEEQEQDENRALEADLDGLVAQEEGT